MPRTRATITGWKTLNLDTMTPVSPEHEDADASRNEPIDGARTALVALIEFSEPVRVMMYPDAIIRADGSPRTRLTAFIQKARVDPNLIKRANTDAGTDTGANSSAEITFTVDLRDEYGERVNHVKPVDPSVLVFTCEPDQLNPDTGYPDERESGLQVRELLRPFDAAITTPSATVSPSETKSDSKTRSSADPGTESSSGSTSEASSGSTKGQKPKRVQNRLF